MPYAVVQGELKGLLERFGPRRKSTHTEYPFWRMRNDGVWEIDRPDLVTTNPRSGDAHPSSLLGQNIRGGLHEDDYDAFRQDRRLAWRIVDLLLDSHFPDSYRDDILQATRIDEALREIPLGEEDERRPEGERAAHDLEGLALF